MAIKREIHVVIQPDGSVEMETHGIKGSECERELKAVEEAVGKVKKRSRTQEYYESSTGKAKTKQKTSAK